MQRYETVLTEDAERDLSEIFDYIAAYDSYADPVGPSPAGFLRLAPRRADCAVNTWRNG